MEFTNTKLKDAKLITPRVFADSRGFFLESYSHQLFSLQGITEHFIQDNHSRSLEIGVLRGLHFQKPPYAQAKLIRVTAGAIFDVIVDLRRKSPTYGAWEGFTISAEKFEILYVPAGFAHGFCTLEENTEVQYKVDKEYSPKCESGIIWNDPTLNIDWPVSDVILSEKDTILPAFKDLDEIF